MDWTDHHDHLSPREDLLTRDELRSKFGILNYAVFIMMLLVSAMIGMEGKLDVSSILFLKKVKDNW